MLATIGIDGIPRLRLENAGANLRGAMGRRYGRSVEASGIVAHNADFPAFRSCISLACRHSTSGSTYSLVNGSDSQICRPVREFLAKTQPDKIRQQNPRVLTCPMDEARKTAS